MSGTCNFAVFEDGHREEIFYYQVLSSGTVFLTQSGAYLQKREVEDFAEHRFYTDKVYKIVFYMPYWMDYLNISTEPAHITQITIDNRMEYKYEIECTGVGKLCGSVFAEKTADDREIRKLVMAQFKKLLKVTYHKADEDRRI